MVTKQRSDDNMLSIRQKAMRYLDPKTDKPQCLHPTNALISTLEDVNLD